MNEQKMFGGLRQFQSVGLHDDILAVQFADQ
jgi:hypothetical protein